MVPHLWFQTIGYNCYLHLNPGRHDRSCALAQSSRCRGCSEVGGLKTLLRPMPSRVLFDPLVLLLGVYWDSINRTWKPPVRRVVRSLPIRRGCLARFLTLGNRRKNWQRSEDFCFALADQVAVVLAACYHVGIACRSDRRIQLLFDGKLAKQSLFSPCFATSRCAWTPLEVETSTDSPWVWVCLCPCLREETSIELCRVLHDEFIFRRTKVFLRSGKMMKLLKKAVPFFKGFCVNCRERWPLVS